MKNITEVVQNQTTKFDAWFETREAPRRNMRSPSPPCSIPDEEDELREEDRIERAQFEEMFMISHSHRAPRGSNPFLGIFLEEDVGKIVELQ